MSEASQAKAGLRVEDFNFELPPELIAQHPPAERGQSRMLVMNRATGDLRDETFSDLPSLLVPGDLLVINDSRVIPARLHAHRTSMKSALNRAQMLRAPSLRRLSGARVGNHEPEPASADEHLAGHIEVMLTEPAGENHWRALVRPGRKVAIGERLVFPTPAGEIPLEAEVLERGQFGERLLRFEPVDDFFAVLERIGHMPLPPYIRRDDAVADRERYQTVFSRERGSVAAPTAGLHFTPQLLEALAEKGVEIARITLHVGLGTFAPLRVDRLDEVRLHRERYTIGPTTAEAINRASREGRRIIAVGTTVVRTLESAAALEPAGADLQPHSGETEIFIAPGFKFRLVDALLTNFHLPKSSLLMLVSAFAGRDHVLAAYDHAVQAKYRFFSYGDCMFLA
jgi:S-adenosylmethionine:tRNA ribosyltransferase-isomerase